MRESAGQISVPKQVHGTWKKMRGKIIVTSPWLVALRQKQRLSNRPARLSKGLKSTKRVRYISTFEPFDEESQMIHPIVSIAKGDGAVVVGGRVVRVMFAASLVA